MSTRFENLIEAADDFTFDVCMLIGIRLNTFGDACKHRVERDALELMDRDGYALCVAYSKAAEPWIGKA